jgi:hypothetical protein
MRTFAIFAWATLVLTAVSTREAAADDLVAAVLPLSRSAQIGQTVTAFATVINSSGGALSGCTASLPNFSGTFVYQTTNPATNALTGSPNTRFSLPNGGSQSLVLALTPAAQIIPTEENFVFQCSGSGAAASIIGVNTLLLSADTRQPADVIASAATPTQDGVLRLPGTSQAGFRRRERQPRHCSRRYGHSRLGGHNSPSHPHDLPNQSNDGSLPRRTDHLDHRHDRRQHYANLRIFRDG